MGYRIIDPIGAQALVARIQSRFAHDVDSPVLVQHDPTPIVVPSFTGINTS